MVSREPEPGVRRQITVHPKELFPMKLSRVLDHELDELEPWLQPIQNYHDDGFFRLRPRERGELAKIFLAAQDLFGRTSQAFDDYKGSFSFPLLISATRDGLSMHYVLDLRDHRGSVEYPFYRVGEERPRDRFAYRVPIDRELSRVDLDYLGDFLTGYLCSLGERLARTAPSFHRVVRSQHFVYGSRSGELFERRVEGEDAFERLITAIARELADVEGQQELAHRRRLLDDMTQGHIRI